MLDWLSKPAAQLDAATRDKALARQAQLTKPPGALGRLEDLAVTLAAMQQTVKPVLDKVHIVVFAGDHGVANEGVSAFPQIVTREMVKNFASGGAAITVMAKYLDTSFEVVDVGTAHPPGDLPKVVDNRIAAGTKNFCEQAAMTPAELQQALEAGREAVRRGLQPTLHLFIGGEMGIANTTSASAVACALLNKKGSELAGPGTGLDQKGVQHKAVVIDRALALHQLKSDQPLEILQCLGGFEIAALCGAYITCAQLAIPVLVDGFIATVAALLAVRINPSVADWFLYAHQSAEPGYKHVITALQARPILDLGMRLGEGSGAATVVPILRMALVAHNEMATFAEAGVSEKS